jgi:1,4-dihydroxy-2-naphthoate octaprenyltransferase
MHFFKHIKSWLKAFRLRTLPLSLSGIIVGCALAKYNGHVDGFLCLLGIITVLFMQILSNLANDLGDSLKGTDNAHRVGPLRSVQSGDITSLQMKKAVIVFSFLSLSSAFPLAYWGTKGLSEAAYCFYLVLALLCVLAAITYTLGKKAYGYLGLGDIFVFLFFGIVSVCGIYGLIAKDWNGLILWPATAFGLLSTAVLNLNNMRDIENDSQSGKRTLVVKIGYEKAKFYHGFLLFAPILCFIIFCINTKDWGFLFILCPYSILVPHFIRVCKEKNNALLDSELKKVALSTFVMAILLAIWVYL